MTQTQTDLVMTATASLQNSLEKSSLKDLVRARTRRSMMLCDCSGSMSTTEGDRRRIDLVNDALKPIRADNPNARIIAFASEPRLCRGDLPPNRRRYGPRRRHPRSGTVSAMPDGDLV